MKSQATLFLLGLLILPVFGEESYEVVYPFCPSADPPFPQFSGFLTAVLDQLEQTTQPGYIINRAQYPDYAPDNRVVYGTSNCEPRANTASTASGTDACQQCLNILVTHLISLCNGAFGSTATIIGSEVQNVDLPVQRCFIHYSDHPIEY